MFEEEIVVSLADLLSFPILSQDSIGYSVWIILGVFLIVAVLVCVYAYVKRDRGKNDNFF